VSAAKGKAAEAPAAAISRVQALAYRVVAQQLDRPGVDDPADLAIADLGIQDSPAGTAALSVAARTAVPSGGEDPATQLADGRRWVVTWAVRGAPHVLRADDVRAMAAATWPADADDAAARLAGFGAGTRKRGDDALAALRAAADALREVVGDTMTKGDVSNAVTKAVPKLSQPCRSCGTTHISDQLMRLAVLPAGLRLDPMASPVTLRPIARWPGVPDEQEGAGAIVEAYLRLHGPATPKEVAAYLQTGQAAVKDVWPGGLAEVTVDGRRAWVPENALEALRRAPAPELVRLLPRSDPWLMARDRELLVPGAAHRKALWPTLGFPGGLLVDGEIAGTWRTKATAARLDVTVQPFRRLSPTVRTALEAEAQRVASVRAVPDVRVAYDGG